MGKLTTQQKQMYTDFKREFRFCWVCKYQPLPKIDMGFPNVLECAHIVGGSGRRADRRCIIQACKIHHMLFDGHSIRHGQKLLPSINIHQAVWLKQQFDPEYVDIEFLKSLRIKRNLPIEPVPVEPIGVAT